MTTLVPVLPQYVYGTPLDLPVWHPQVDFLVDVAVRKIVRHYLVPKLMEDGYTVGPEEHVFTSIMIRVRPAAPGEPTPYPRLEVTFPHPGAETMTWRDPYDRTPHWDGHAELVGGSEDGRLIPLANDAPEHWRVIPETTLDAGAVWEDTAPGEYPTPTITPTLTYTRSGVDLTTGHWHYRLTSGG